MADLLKKEREFVVPGDEIVKSMDYLPGKNCFREGDSIYSKRLGIVSLSNRVISVIPFNTPYMPHVGDMIIGQVVDVQSNGWLIDAGAPWKAFMPLSGVRGFIDTTKTKLSSIYATGDILHAKVSAANGDTFQVSMQDPRARKLKGGEIVKISSAKVPRLIGKQGSMVTMIKNETGCRISIGQNGLVWFEGENTELLKKAVETVEKEAYVEGLTDKIEKMLEKGKEKTQSKEKK